MFLGLLFALVLRDGYVDLALALLDRDLLLIHSRLDLFQDNHEVLGGVLVVG